MVLNDNHSHAPLYSKDLFKYYGKCPIALHIVLVQSVIAFINND